MGIARFVAAVVWDRSVGHLLSAANSHPVVSVSFNEVQACLMWLKGRAERLRRASGDCTRRVVRGGSSASAHATIRSAPRLSQLPSCRAADVGFRLAR